MTMEAAQSDLKQIKAAVNVVPARSWREVNPCQDHDGSVVSVNSREVVVD